LVNRNPTGPWDQGKPIDDGPRVEPSDDGQVDPLDGLEVDVSFADPRRPVGHSNHTGLEGLSGEALRDHFRIVFGDNVPALTVENAEMIKSIVGCLVTGRASLHSAGCGSGKTFCGVLAVCYLGRRGHHIVFLEPTVAVAFEVEGLFKSFAPDLNVSAIYGRPARKDG
jgi:hypothetical protein